MNKITCLIDSSIVTTSWFFVKCVTSRSLKHVLQPKRKVQLSELTSSERFATIMMIAIFASKLLALDIHILYFEQRVLDHDHFVKKEGKDFGRFRGPVHRHCNLQYHLSRIIPTCFIIFGICAIY